jgi:hypothetical protein
MGVGKIVLISSGQPATNPRLVKEADLLQNAGYDVTVLYCHFIPWADKADESLLKDVIWKHQLVGGSPTVQRAVFFATRLRHKIARKINAIVGNRWSSAERSQARAFDELLSAAKAT